MLRHRVITAVVLLSLFVAAVWYLPTVWFALSMGVIITLGAWEWSSLAGLSSPWPRLGFVVLIAGLLWMMFILKATVWALLLMLTAVVGWVLVLVLILAVEKHLVVIPTSRLIKLLLGCLVLVPPWLGLVFLHGDRITLLFLVALIAIADISAYFSGRRWGGRKLAPTVSPGKTLAGLWGALAATLLVAVGYGLVDNMQDFELLMFSILCLVTVLFSVAGDLIESLMKRSMQRKDSGAFLPGHGGILDRIDSHTAAIPVFITGILLWSIYL